MYSKFLGAVAVSIIAFLAHDSRGAEARFPGDEESPPKAFRLTGIVVDVKGRPVSGATLQFHRPYMERHWMVAVEAAETTAEGRFDIGPFPVMTEREHFDTPIHFRKKGYVELGIEIYAVPKNKRAAMRVVLAASCSWSGVLVSPKGVRLGGVEVEARFKDPEYVRMAKTDKRGAFKLDGLPQRPGQILAFAFDHDCKLAKQVDFDGNRDGFRLVAQPLGLRKVPETYEVAGLLLADVTPDLKKAFGLVKTAHVLVWGVVSPQAFEKHFTMDIPPRRGHAIMRVVSNELDLDVPLTSVRHLLELFVGNKAGDVRVELWMAGYQTSQLNISSPYDLYLTPELRKPLSARLAKMKDD